VTAGQTPARGDNVVDITLGHSAVSLNGPWKFTVGDSPVDPTTHAPLWAEWDLTTRSGRRST
jgi:hypothetical protein